MVHRATELVHVRTADDTVTATPNHPFRVAGRGWVAAGELSAGDTLYLADGGGTSIVSVTREKLASPVDVYNLEVEDFHTYFVAGTGVWVHNCGGATVYRAVQGAEARDVVANGVYRVGGNGMATGKLFYPTAAQAQNLASMFKGTSGEAAYYLTSGIVPASTMSQSTVLQIGGEGEAIFIESHLLPTIANVTMHGPLQ